MSRISLFWYSPKIKTYKYLSFKRSLALTSAAFISLLLILCCYFSYQSLNMQNKLAQLKTSNKELVKKNQKKEHKIQEIQKKLSAKKDTVEQLNQKCAHFQDQLGKIKKMETKIRHYLGLYSDDKKIKDHSHQGGFQEFNPDFQDYSPNSRPPFQGKPTKVSLRQKYQILSNSLEQISQYLVEKKKILKKIPSILPVIGEDVWLSCGYGWRNNPFTSKKEFHAAIDIAGRLKTPLIAPADGKVIDTGRNKIWGKYIKIQHDQSISTAYGHLYSFEVSEGQEVKRRDVIGYMGSTGHSTGTHVHYKVLRNNKAINPKQFVLDRDFNSLSLKEQYEKEK